jgi:hypothetical protein
LNIKEVEERRWVDFVRFSGLCVSSHHYSAVRRAEYVSELVAVPSICPCGSGRKRPDVVAPNKDSFLELWW